MCLKANLRFSLILFAFKGSFEWNGVNFSETAEDTSLNIGDDARIVADLKSRDQQLMKATLNLDERITNVDGRLVFGEF